MKNINAVSVWALIYKRCHILFKDAGVSKVATISLTGWTPVIDGDDRLENTSAEINMDMCSPDGYAKDHIIP